MARPSPATVTLRRLRDRLAAEVQAICRCSRACSPHEESVRAEGEVPCDAR